MKAFLYKVLIFTLLLVVFNYFYLILVKSTDWGFKKRIESISFGNPAFDVLIIGNSLALDGIDAGYMSEVGHNTYNLAIGGASVRTSYVQLKEYLEMYDYTPEIVILGLGSYTGTFSSATIHPVVEFTSKEHSFGPGDIPVVKFKWMFKEMLKKILSKHHRDAFLVNGQLRFNKQMPDDTRIVPGLKLPVEKYTRNKTIHDIIALCNHYNITLYIVEMPGYKFVRHQVPVENLVLDPVNKNGYFLDYNTVSFGTTFNDQTDWVGNSHLNVDGARKFTRVLIQDIFQ